MQQNIYYIDYCKRGEKVRNVGFVKSIYDGEGQRLELRICNAETDMTGSYKVKLLSQDGEMKEISLSDELQLEKGRGEWAYACTSGKWNRNVKLMVNVEAGKTLEVDIPEGVLVEVKEESKESEAKKTEEMPETPKPQKESTVIPSQVPEPEMTVQEKNKGTDEEETEENKEEKEEEKEEELEKKKDKDKESVIQMENSKWKQICKVFPHKHYFEDERDYITIHLQDLILLGDEDYVLAKNIFLTYGYETYDYLVLWQEKKDDKTSLYIGVPGLFYEKECRAAVFYGFERFECKQEPPKEGELGFYMKRINL